MIDYDSDSAFRVISYDLDTKKLETYFKQRQSGYKALIKALRKRGYERRQFSGYISNKPLKMTDVFEDVKAVCDKLPWLSDCINKFDVTSVGLTHDLSGYVDDFCNQSKLNRKDIHRGDVLSGNLFQDEFAEKTDEIKSKIASLSFGSLKDVLSVVDKAVDFIGDDKDGFMQFRLNVVQEKDDGSLFFLKGNEASTIRFSRDELQQKMADYQAVGESSEVESFLKAAYVYNLKLRQKVIANVVQEEQNYYKRLAARWGLDISDQRSKDKDKSLEIDHSEFFAKYLNRRERGGRER